MKKIREGAYYLSFEGFLRGPFIKRIGYKHFMDFSSGAVYTEYGQVDDFGSNPKGCLDTSNPLMVDVKNFVNNKKNRTICDTIRNSRAPYQWGVDRKIMHTTTIPKMLVDLRK